MRDEELPGKQDEGAKRKPGADGFFTIQKKGQGYWTRMGTAIGIAILAVFTSYNIFIDLPTLLPAPQIDPTLPVTTQAMLATQIQTLHFRVALGAAVVFLIGFSLLGFWISNKPTNVDFLIATDSEMKKVNWTSRRDLIASTKIVIIFMFSVAIFLFAVDLLFNFLFYHMHVLKSSGI